jgi:hypothetical protein
MVPIRVGVKQNRKPMSFKTVDPVNGTWNPGKLAGRPAQQRVYKRVMRIEYEVRNGVFPDESPAIPPDMPQLAIFWDRLSQNLSLVVACGKGPSRRAPQLKRIHELNPGDGPKHGKHQQEGKTRRLLIPNGGDQKEKSKSKARDRNQNEDIEHVQDVFAVKENERE